jgi:hypothetical protein
MIYIVQKLCMSTAVLMPPIIDMLHVPELFQAVMCSLPVLEIWTNLRIKLQ